MPEEDFRVQGWAMVRRVLFVDDDEILQLMVEKGLAPYADSFGVVLAKDGFEALKKLEDTAVSLIIIDLLMPRMDGFSLLSHIRETYPDIPVVFVSATPKEMVPYLKEMQGVLAYLEKPFSIDNLAKCIQDALVAEALGGAIAAVSPTMFLQLMEMEGKTCTIRIFDNDSMEGGILYLQDGRLLDARVGNMKGIEGVYRIFMRDEVSVYFSNDYKKIEGRVDSGLQAVIMGALAARNEEADSPFAEAEGSITGFAEGLVPVDNPQERFHCTLVVVDSSMA
jgi:CheY-like chemotaxis protein